MEKNYIPDVDFTSKNFEEFLPSMKIACAVLKKEVLEEGYRSCGNYLQEKYKEYIAASQNIEKFLCSRR